MGETIRTCYACHVRDTCNLCREVSASLLKYNAWYDARRTRIATAEIYSGLGRMCTEWKVDPLVGLLANIQAVVEESAAVRCELD